MRALALAALLLASAAARAADEPKPPKDLDAAKVQAAARGVRILAVVTTEAYPSEPCRRLEKALEDPAARKAAEPFVLLRVAEKEEAAFSKALGTEDLGHPYTALLDAAGKAIATVRGARDGAGWAREVERLAKGADALDRCRAALEKAPGDVRALWDLSEALRDLGRVREADEALGRAEKADPADRAALRPLFAFRRLEARVEDRMALQDFDGARALLDAYDREHPTSPRRSWVAFYRAIARAHRGEAEGALDDLKDLAARPGDEALAALAKEKAAALEKALTLRK